MPADRKTISEHVLDAVMENKALCLAIRPEGFVEAAGTQDSGE
jgi:hypothetical protein